MQFFAFAGNQRIDAEKAQKGQDYRCPECQGLLRVKEGHHRRKHFFHLSRTERCRLNQKSLLHLTIQKALIKALREHDTTLEKRFPKIQRIADVVWESKKLIFEVQCSPITLAEVKNRMADYAKEGYRVIWVLHDRRFNRRRLSAAEHYLRPKDAFFTSLNPSGKGQFYDQAETLRHFRRLQKSSPIPIDLQNPLNRPTLPKLSKKNLFLKKILLDQLRFYYYLLLKKAS